MRRWGTNSIQGQNPYRRRSQIWWRITWVIFLFIHSLCAIYAQVRMRVGILEAKGHCQASSSNAPHLTSFQWESLSLNLELKEIELLSWRVPWTHQSLLSSALGLETCVVRPAFHIVLGAQSQGLTLAQHLLHPWNHLPTPPYLLFFYISEYLWKI